jgi:hypothetical protein
VIYNCAFVGYNENTIHDFTFAYLSPSIRHVSAGNYGPSSGSGTIIQQAQLRCRPLLYIQIQANNCDIVPRVG